MNYSCLNGQIVPSAEALIPAQSRAAYYGDGCFETLKSYAGKFVAFDKHFRRLLAGMEYLGISTPDFYSTEYFENCIHRLIEQNGLDKQEARVRIQVWREGKPGYHTGTESLSSFFITASPLVKGLDSMSLAVADTRRVPASALDSSYKLSNGINYIRASREAVAKGADDALMLTTDGFVSETCIANIFWIKDRTVFTPSKDSDILPGITRSLVIEMLENDEKWAMFAGRYTLIDILEADTIFVTNSIREILPVKMIDGKEFSISSPSLLEIIEQFGNEIKNLCH